MSLSGTDPGIDIPSDWNLPDIENLDGWVIPGQSNTGSPWDTYNPGGGWIWLGDRLTTGVDPDKSENNPWVKNNFTLFRYEFICMADYCDTEEGWEADRIINVDSREWNDIKQIEDAEGFADPQTYPIFAGGILSFNGSGDWSDYTPNFFLADEDFLEEVDLSELWNEDSNSDDKNVIDVAGNKVTFTGNLVGLGGMAFRSTGRGEASRGSAILAGENTYSGETVVESGTLALARLNALNP